MYRTIPFVLAFLAAPIARAQTTQPADQPWPKAVSAFAQALVAGDADAAGALLADRCSVRPFNQRDDDTAMALLLERAGKAHLLGAHPAIHPAPSMAATLYNSFSKSVLVPDALKKKMAPGDDAATKAANTTAQVWMATELNAKAGDAVAVIVIWCSKKTPALPLEDRPPAPPEMEPLWVLIKGIETPAKDYRICTVVFGDPLLK